MSATPKKQSSTDEERERFDALWGEAIDDAMLERVSDGDEPEAVVTYGR